MTPASINKSPRGHKKTHEIPCHWLVSVSGVAAAAADVALAVIAGNSSCIEKLMNLQLPSH